MSRKRPTEGRYSRVTRRVWNSADFRALSSPRPNAQTLFFRLLTGPELGIVPGLYEFRAAGVADSLGWSVVSLRKCLAEIELRGMARHDSDVGVMWVPKAINHNPPDNPNVVRGWRSAWKEVPACELKESARIYIADFCAAKGDVWANSFADVTGNTLGNPFPNPLPKGYPKRSGNQDQEQDQEQEQEVGEPSANLPDLVWLNQQAAERGWMGSLFASERTKQSAHVVIGLATKTAGERGVRGWRPVFERVFAAWLAENEKRINLPNWPSKLAEDWHQCVTHIDEAQP